MLKLLKYLLLSICQKVYPIKLKGLIGFRVTLILNIPHHIKHTPSY